MQPQFNNNKEAINAKYKEQTKAIRPWVLIASLCFIAACGIGIYSSAQLINDYSYMTGVQYTAIVLGSLAILFIIWSTFVIFNAKSTQTQIVLSLVGTYLMFCGMLALMFVSIISTVLSIQCGYFIYHDGDADGGFIQISLQTDNTYPSCSTMENNGLDMRKQILFYSAEVIVNYCNLVAQGDAYQSCLSIGSLLVEDWSSMFLFQLIGLIVGAVVYVFVVVTNILMLTKLKKILEEEKKQQALVGSQQQWNNMQYQANGFIANQQQNYLQQNNNYNTVSQGQLQQGYSGGQYIPPSINNTEVPVGQRL